MKSARKPVYRLVYAAACLALALVLPFLTGQIPQIGNALCPMHLPVFLCGFLCGWPYALIVGFIAPLLRGVLFGMPPFFPTGLSMAFELAAYGLFSGLLSRRFPRTLPGTYAVLLISMIGGRLVWGAVRFLFAGLAHSTFSPEAFLTGAVLNAVPGIIVQLILIPVLVTALRKAHLSPETESF